MKCNEIPFGTGYCAYAIYLPWKVWYNPYRPNDEDSFIPKTKLIYGESKNNGEWD